MALSLSSLISIETLTAIYERGLDVAEAVGLPVTSWRPGDPTRSLYYFLASILDTLEPTVAAYIRSGFLTYAAGDWLTLLASEMYGVTRTPATYASGTLTLTNAGGGEYVIEANTLRFRNSVTDATYTNTSGGTLAPGPATTLTLDFVADASGSEGSAATDEIDEIIVGELLEVTITASDAAVGVDEQSDDSLKEQCRDSLGALSPGGPSSSYEFVALNQSLTGDTSINRARAFGDSDTGDVTLFLASSSGAASAADIAAVETACAKWATPLCITLTVQSASESTVDLEFEVSILEAAGLTEAQVRTLVDALLVDLEPRIPLGGYGASSTTSGVLSHALMASEIKSVAPDYIFNVTFTDPATDQVLAPTSVVVWGTISYTVVFY